VIAFAHAQLSDDAPGSMLHLLDAGVDDNDALADHGAGQLGSRGPPADPERHEGNDEHADDHVPLNRL